MNLRFWGLLVVLASVAAPACFEGQGQAQSTPQRSPAAQPPDVDVPAIDHEPSRRKGITLAFTGDVFPDAYVKNWVERRAETGSLAQAYAELFEETAATLSSADLAVVNLETPISERYLDDTAPQKPVFNAPPALVEGLKAAGADVLTLANNHAYDQGFQGLADTLNTIRALGIVPVGAGPTSAAACGPAYAQTQGATVGFCAWSQGTNRHMPRERDGGSPRVAFVHNRTIRSCVAKARDQSHLVVAAFHWSAQQWNGPGTTEAAVVEQAAAAGADIVVAHGPHVPGPAGWLESSSGRRTLVLYSLGNLLGAMGSADRSLYTSRAGVRDAPIVTVETTWEGQRLRPTGLRVDPYWIARPMPRAQWWQDNGGQPLIRPLSITRELARLEAARCGRTCSQRQKQYERRVRLQKRAFDLGEVALAMAEPTAELQEPAAEPAQEEPAAEPAQEEPAAEPAQEEPGAEHITIGALRHGMVLPIRFTTHQPAIAQVDDPAIDDIVALLLEHRSTGVHLTGYASSGGHLDAPTLARRRARQALWLLATPGPSRSRFTVEAVIDESLAGQGRVSIRVTE